jgi:hypothetical protein
MLNSPEFLSLRLLPESYVKVLEDDLLYMRQFFSEEEVDKLSRLIDWMKSAWDHNEKDRLMADFYFYFTEYDRRRNLNFKKALPDLVPFMNECQLAAEIWKMKHPERFA